MDGIPIMTNAPNRITKRFLADEAFKNWTAPGIAAKHVNAQRLKSRTAEQRNDVEATFDSSQLNLINSPFAYINLTDSVVLHIPTSSNANLPRIIWAQLS
jgi:hypothetical protein